MRYGNAVEVAEKAKQTASWLRQRQQAADATFIDSTFIIHIFEGRNVSWDGG